ncbi:hypothetical protein QTO34_016909 [Cnephaeus nilssonii]|uniref:Uncharacterized protein n=1 Tax=Cnephaeus nilssonii TaxID=3371016 RepID=A0AA40LSA1_CNENI|nr:hypothetical protein QTO34_016909 [Eptesicus nilssonii]
MEVFFKIFVFCLEFFHCKFEILGSSSSWFHSSSTLSSCSEFEALGLLILLWLWQVAWIINGIVISVKTCSERQLCSEKKQEIERHNKLLRQHGLRGEPLVPCLLAALLPLLWLPCADGTSPARTH